MKRYLTTLKWICNYSVVLKPKNHLILTFGCGIDKTYVHKGLCGVKLFARATNR